MKAIPPGMNEATNECVHLIRAYLTSKDDPNRVLEVVRKGHQMVTFLERGMDSLTKKERLEMYGSVYVLFPRDARRILVSRLAIEEDRLCRTIIRQAVQSHDDFQRTRDGIDDARSLRR